MAARGPANSPACETAAASPARVSNDAAGQQAAIGAVERPPGRPGTTTSAEIGFIEELISSLRTARTMAEALDAFHDVVGFTGNPRWNDLRSATIAKLTGDTNSGPNSQDLDGSSNNYTESGAPQRKKRKTWSEKTKLLIVEADKHGGRPLRHSVANLVGMSHGVADAVITRWRKTADLKDGRKSRKGPSPKTKLKPHHKDYLRQFLSEDSTITLSTLRTCLNEEILRDLLLEYKAELSPDEKHFGNKIVFDYSEWFNSHEEARVRYDAAVIRSAATVGQALNCMIFTRKLTRPIRNTMNCENHKNERLLFCNELLQFATGKIRADFYFVGEMPYYVSQHRQYGQSPRGQRGTVLVPPGSTMSVRGQVALAVHPTQGLLHSSINKLEKIILTSHGGRESKQFAQVWDEDKFVSFMDRLFITVKNRTALRAGDHCADFNSPCAYFLYDCAPEDIDNTMKRVSELASFKALNALLHERHVNGELSGAVLRKLPPVSPNLNLTEYVHSTLRTEAQKQMDKEENTAVMLGLRTPSDSTGSVVQDRLTTLAKCITGGLEQVQEHSAQSTSWTTLLTVAKNCIRDGGALEPQGTEPA